MGFYGKPFQFFKNYFAPSERPSSGWHTIFIQTSLENPSFKYLSKIKPSIFHESHKILDNLYISYLNESNIEELSSTKLFKIDKTMKNRINYENILPNTNYEVIADESWSTPLNYQHINFEKFILNDLTYNQFDMIYNDEKVYKITQLPKIKFESRISVGYVESGQNSLIYEDSGLLRTPRTLKAKGLDGTGEIVTIQDTKIDTNHSFFYDNNEFGDLHRKILKYNMVEAAEKTSDHGTHMAGLIAGAPISDTDFNILYEGVAPRSKLFVNEVYNESDVNFTKLIEEMKEVGSFILSNSWDYNQRIGRINYEVAKLAFENKDINFVMPIGSNNRPTTPSTISNVLTVGSSSKPTASNIENSYNGKLIISNSTTNIEATENNYTYSIFYKKTSPIVNYHNLKISLVDEADSIFISLNCIEGTTAKAVIYPDNITNCTNLDVPILFVHANDIDTLKQMEKVDINFGQDFGDYTPMKSQGSARGPNEWGVKKPDILIPGDNIYSAKAGIGYTDTSFNSLVAMSGSSTSTAQAAGFCALIRQYFKEGYYPSLTKNTSNSLSPSSSLIKSLLINCAVNIDLYNQYVGYGVPNLQNGLGFGKYGVRFYDRIKIERKNHIVFKFTTTKTSDFSITMNYLDFPFNEDEQRYIPLLIDLNLIVVTQDGRYYTGNMLDDNRNEELSTVEKIILKDLEPQTLTIHIYSNDYKKDQFENETAEFSLSIIGGFDTNDTITNPLKFVEIEKTNVVNNCSGFSHDENGVCECPLEAYGSFCQNRIEYWNKAFTTVISLKNKYPTYIGIDIPYYTKYAPIFMTLGSYDGFDNYAIDIGIGKGGIMDTELYYRLVVPTPPNQGLTLQGKLYDVPGPHYFVLWNFDIEEASILLGVDFESVPAPSPTPDPTKSPDPTPAATPSITPAQTPDPTPSPHPTKTLEPTPDATPSSTPSSTPDVTPEQTPSSTPNTTPVETPYRTPAMTPLPSTIPATRSPARTIYIIESKNESIKDRNVPTPSDPHLSVIIIIVIILATLICAIILIILFIYIRKCIMKRIEDDITPESLHAEEEKEYLNTAEDFINLGVDHDDVIYNSESNRFESFDDY